MMFVLIDFLDEISASVWPGWRFRKTILEFVASQDALRISDRS
jgi:hypothetical protein